MEIVEVNMVCRVPSAEAEDYITKLRLGEERLPVPAGLVCRDAFECRETADQETTLIRVGYR
jgi:hypothetical protein